MCEHGYCRDGNKIMTQCTYEKAMYCNKNNVMLTNIFNI